MYFTLILIVKYNIYNADVCQNFLQASFYFNIIIVIYSIRFNILTFNSASSSKGNLCKCL